MSIEITDSNFSSIVEQREKIVLVDFWAQWCGPCKVLGPTIDEIHNENKDDNVIISKVNVDENSQLTTRFKIKGIPALLFFKNGELVEQTSGIKSKEQILTIINNIKNK